jgi:hypothetical protein
MRGGLPEGGDALYGVSRPDAQSRGSGLGHDFRFGFPCARRRRRGENAFPEENRVLDGLVDPIGTLYKYAFAKYGRVLKELAKRREVVRA